MKCPICKEDKWLDIDYLRMKKENFVVCEGCGFITYNKTEKEITDMYRVSAHNAARKYAGSGDMHSKNHKLPYHKKMLEKYFKDKSNLEILDYGCSTGYILNWLKNQYPLTNIEGIELNPAHAEFGRREYGLTIHEIAKLSELPDKEKKYDLIINFAVLEHILDPVSALKEMREKLTDDGIIYLMTPIWLDTLYTSDFQIVPFEHLFIPHHVSCFTETSRNNCFKLAGLEIIEHNNAMYGDMVILKKCEPSNVIKKENAKTVQKKISNTKKAIELMFQQRQDQSVELWEKNPDYWVGQALQNKDNLQKHKDNLIKAIETCPNHAKLHENLGHFYLQNGEYENAIKKFEETIDMCPNMYKSYWNLSEIYILQEDYEKAIGILKKLIEVNPDMKHRNFINDGETVIDRLGMIYAKMV